MRSKRLGNELRRLRRAKGLTVSEAAIRLGCGQPKISQIENGKRGIRPADLTALLDLYDVTDEGRRRSIKQLARDIHKVDWWTSEGPLTGSTLTDYLTLEVDSELIRTYESTVIPGLLQAESYIRQVITPANCGDEAEARIQARLKRKELLDGYPALQMSFIIDQLALHRIQGSHEVISEQLHHLIDMGHHPNVMLQVLPLKADLPPRQYVPFSLARYRGESSLEVVWLEHTNGGTLLEQDHDVRIYMQVWAELTAAALSPADSRLFLRELMKEYVP
ncbi:helix-turn-helix domain-containing protein [Streptomyces mobaraensis]|uniref:helix-turn-helix domain-containing protein n=1 Tax=Streptomyces mobaraensis TaxID=35621 RepID=UPI003411C3E2